ncbi:hypothetical protein N183_38220 [Sinorhizobium sp. Sb3]|nr:hypothetical protein N183_38220 [Sinorhizobium sp. Sb3]
MGRSIKFENDAFVVGRSTSFERQMYWAQQKSSKAR